MIIQNTNQAIPPIRTQEAAPSNNIVSTPARISNEPTKNDIKRNDKPPPSPEQLQEALDVVNTVMQQSGNRLEFSIDKDSSRLVVKLVDTETGELIRQIPSEETLAIARSIDQFQQGMLLNQKA